jgi:cytochrome c peroxidase
MMRDRSYFSGGLLAAAVAAVAAVAVVGCGGEEDDLVDGVFTAEEWARVETLSPLPDVPAEPTNRYADDPAAAALGQRLFFEKRFGGPIQIAADGTNGGLGAEGETGVTACVDCHDARPTGWFSDTRSNPNATSLGSRWTPRNSPTQVNVAYYEWYAWAGRGDSNWMKCMQPFEAPPSLNSSRARIAHVLYDYYKDDYEAIFGSLDPRLDPADPNAADFPADARPGMAGDARADAWAAMAPADQDIVNRIYANAGKALDAYYRRLVSRNAPFDQYVAGDTAAINQSAKRGLRLFIGKAGCVGCHDNPIFTDNDFHNTGVPQEGDVPPMDVGRFGAIEKLLSNIFNSSGEYSDDRETGRLDGVAQDESQLGQFRTKHLRQIAGTGPYMHTGAFETLREVVEFYNAGGMPPAMGTLDPNMIPLNLTEGEIDDLVAFLETLTGEPIPAELSENTAAP